MSIFGVADDVDLRCWQARNLKALTALVKIGQEARLHPLDWRLPTVGDVVGTTDRLTGSPRAQFAAWHDALLADKRITTRGLGLNEELPHRREHTDSFGRTRITASLAFALTNRAFEAPVRVCLVAEFDELDVTDESQSDAEPDTIEAQA